ncbi:DNA topoisomerase VI subunit B, partial [Candidatus Woesearchaeota archaeon]|nr:DNA topoisomerase VI subunit B [Candidatus Woesearchaeota archaeon]
ISPITADLLEKGLKKEINAEFYAAVTRSPKVYRGNPFVVEVGVAYGGEQLSDSSIKLFRYANRVPLQYQQSACAFTKSVTGTTWRNYGLSQSRGSLPIGPVTIAIHIASVWVPFTSESKEAIAHYPDIVKEIKFAIQDCGRKLGSYIGKKKKVQFEGKKRDYIKMFIPHVGQALQELIGLNKTEEQKVEEILTDILEDTRGKLEKVEAVNTEYDAEFAKIGKEEKVKEDKEDDKKE